MDTTFSATTPELWDTKFPNSVKIREISRGSYPGVTETLGRLLCNFWVSFGGGVDSPKSGLPTLTSCPCLGADFMHKKCIKVHQSWQTKG